MGVVPVRRASALAMVPVNSGSTMTALASPWSSMKAMASGSSRVLRVLSTAPAMGTPKCASTMGGVLGSITATVAFLPMPALASALTKAGIGKNDTVAVMLPNTPPMVEAHFGVPMAGAVLNTLNTRLDPEAIAFMLDHGEAKAVIVDPEFTGTMAKALALRTGTTPIRLIEVQDALYGPAVQSLGGTDYEAFV